MIELTWNFIYANDHDTLMNLTSLLSWITTEIKFFDIGNSFLNFRGYIVFQQPDGKYKALLLTDSGERENKFLNVIKQPPGEFSGKYEAIIYQKTVVEEGDEEKIVHDMDDEKT